MAKTTIARRRNAAAMTPLAAGESVFTPRPYQRAFIADKSRSKAAMWSRQTGKGFAVALEVNDDILTTEARGDAIDWLIVSRSLVAARQLGRKVRGIGRAMCEAMRLVEPKSEDLGESQTELVYPGGSRVLILSSSPDAAVGFTGNVVIDEIDTHKQAFELLGNTMPVASTGEYRVIITSTPRGRRVMHRIWTDSQKAGTEWSFHKLTIHEAIEQGCKQDAARLRRQILDDLKWRQEYLCEFVDDEICWIPWELIAGCTSDEASMGFVPRELPADRDQVYAGWDIARWNHLSVLWFLRKRHNRLITSGVYVMSRMGFEKQLDLVAAKIGQFENVDRLCLDAGGMGEPLFEFVKKRVRCSVEGVKFTNPIKEAMSTDVRRLMEERNLLIPDDEGIQNDFHSLRRTVTAAGNARFEGEENGSHADRYWACALALHGALDSRGGIGAPPPVRIDRETPKLARPRGLAKKLAGI